MHSMVEWHRLGPTLWVGEHDGNHVGIVERGRRYTAIDGRGQVRGTFVRFAEARTALERMDAAAVH